VVAFADTAAGRLDACRVVAFADTAAGRLDACRLAFAGTVLR
jgi:hypothetical protein